MTQAKLGDTVKIHYIGKLEDGSVFDSSVDRLPIEFTLGEKGVLPGLEDVVAGMSPGDKRTVDIPAVQAYGLYDDDLVQEIERSSLPEDLDPKVGVQLRASCLGAKEPDPRVDHRRGGGDDCQIGCQPPAGRTRPDVRDRASWNSLMEREGVVATCSTRAGEDLIAESRRLAGKPAG